MRRGRGVLSRSWSRSSEGSPPAMDGFEGGAASGFWLLASDFWLEVKLRGINYPSYFIVFLLVVKGGGRWPGCLGLGIESLPLRYWTDYNTLSGGQLDFRFVSD